MDTLRVRGENFVAVKIHISWGKSKKAISRSNSRLLFDTRLIVVADTPSASFVLSKEEIKVYIALIES